MCRCRRQWSPQIQGKVYFSTTVSFPAHYQARAILVSIGVPLKLEQNYNQKHDEGWLLAQ